MTHNMHKYTRNAMISGLWHEWDEVGACDACVGVAPHACEASDADK